MPLRLRIENVSSLPDGGPIEVTLEGRRSIDIGRDQYLDWVLPDPDRAISGKHAEIRYRDGAHWLHDVSRNGTFLNRSGQRMGEAHRLADGDRIEIGHYVIAVLIDGGEASASMPLTPADAPSVDGLWAPTGEIAPAISARDLRPPRSLQPVRPDFIDWAVDVPAADDPFHPSPAAGSAPRFPSPSDMDWAPPAAPSAPIDDMPALPTPRRRGSPPPAASLWGATEQDDAPAWDVPPLPDAKSEHDRAPSPATHDDPEPRPAPPDSQGFAASRDAFATPPDNPQPPPPRAPASDELMRRLAQGLGVPVETIAWRDPGDLAEELGALLRLTAENVKMLLAARAEAKRVARAANQTMIQALDNNPLKFAPTTNDALRIMLGRPSGGYLDSRSALEASFRDLKAHQVKTFSAMQHAARLLLEDLAPDAIAEADEGDKGLGGLIGSRKARLWEAYASRWNAVASSNDDGMTGAFTLLFAECYEGSR